MKKLLAITDLTRMQQGRVCVAGYDSEGNCIRPVRPPPGISEKSLLEGGKATVFPFAVVEFDLLEHFQLNVNINHNLERHYIGV